MEVAVKITKATLHREGTSASIEQVAWWAPEPVWTIGEDEKKFLSLPGFEPRTFHSGDYYTSVTYEASLIWYVFSLFYRPRMPLGRVEVQLYSLLGPSAAGVGGLTPTPGKDLVPIVQGAGCAPGPVWRAENLVSTGIRSRAIKPVAQSLYRLSYPAHVFDMIR